MSEHHSIVQLGWVRNPESAVLPFLLGDASFILSISWDIQEYWLNPEKVTRLSGLLARFDGRLCCAISDKDDVMLQFGKLSACDSLEQLADNIAMPLIFLDQPLVLEPVDVPKPWGREIWFTGMEARGVSCAEGIPLPWIMSFSPLHLTGGPWTEPILLKILDPLAEEVFGDLYFEMHENKQEVYVVTHVDPAAWPEGEGCIKLGFDPSVVKTYESPESFLNAYKAAVLEYRGIRQTIDGLLDLQRTTLSLSKSEPVPLDTLKSWLSKVPQALIDEEHKKRRHMDRFTYMNRLKPGDVIKVPTLVPHSLQHGVRVIEFQSPHYERYILSFAQKVLTQDHWDTEEALKKAKLIFATEEVKVLQEKEDCRVEQLVMFDSFQAIRIMLEPEAVYELSPGTYAIAIGISGEAICGPKQLLPEQALYIPACSLPLSISCKEKSCLLIAQPITR
ncbi:MAG: hypothetical protein OEZ23_04350 [Gammaproteobacteria bacterium]|nr:hypothetical protein [Gammaproteobacteria bacterium]